VNLTVTNEPKRVSRNTKTYGLQDFQLPDMSASSGPPGGAYTCKTDELLVNQNTVSDGQATSIKERAQHVKSELPSSNLVEVC
jgi:hypothetical protein